MKKAIGLIALAIVIGLIPLLIISDSEFAGADGIAEDVIAEINPAYEPWVEPLIEPPGGETESLLFSLQAALGASVMGYILGSFVTRKKLSRDVA